MRQQLITWLIEDIAPQIRQSRDPEGTIVKFARDHNLAPSLVQAMGQLYNTAKTIAFLEKSGSAGRGESFPILDVDKLVDRFMEVEKKASIATGTIDHWEADLENGGLDLPACFQGQLTPVYREEKIVNKEAPHTKVARAMANLNIEKLNTQLAKQVLEDTREAMRSKAAKFVTLLRQHSEYPFEAIEADALGYLGDAVKPVLEKLAKFCKDDGWPVKRASAPTVEKMLNPYQTDVMQLIDELHGDVFTIQASQEYLKEAADTATATPPKTNPSSSGAPAGASGGGSGAPAGGPKTTDRKSGPGGPGAPAGAGGKGGGKDLIGTVSSEWDKILNAPKQIQPLVDMGKGLLGSSRNKPQEQVDSSMMDVRHTALLQNLLTTDEILSEADPDRVVDIYNTIRQQAPDLAADANVMRVLLRSAIQHDGIDPFALKGILETENEVQKGRFNRKLEGEMNYNNLPFQQSKPQPK